MAPELVVVASPRLIGEGRVIQSPADCLTYPLLQDPDRRDWPLWLEAHGVTSGNADRGPAFSDDHLLVRALYAEEEIAAGRLVKVLDIRWPTEFAYYLAGTASGFAKPSARRFAAWLASELGEPASGHSGSVTAPASSSANPGFQATSQRWPSRSRKYPE